MTRGARALAVATVLAAAVVIALPGAGPAVAVSGLQSGYWWQAQPDGAPLPPPPNVPANGLWVSGTTDAQQAIAAVRFDLGDTETAPVLTLKVHSKNPPEQLTAAANAGVAIVLACLATKPWNAGSAEAWSSRPTGNCNSPVHGTLNGDATTVTFDLSSAVTNGAVDVVLEPGAGGSAALPSAPVVPGAPAPPQPSGGFDITFDPVAPAQIVTSPG